MEDTSFDFAEAGDGDLLTSAMAGRHAKRLQQLEREVIELAVAWFHDDGERTPLANAVEALLREQEGEAYTGTYSREDIYRDDD